MSNQKPVLTISLLISNRPDTIPKCLDSLKPIMEAIPSELILIDTSKNEEIHKLLLNYTNQVYLFEWCKDFAKARNEGLKRAKGEWFMFLDDDEWFVEYDELIDFFKSGEYKHYGRANYTIRNFVDVEYKRYNDTWGSRLFHIDEDSEFVGKVHELYKPARGKLKYIESIAYHSGYIFETEEAARKHFERNTQILLQLLEEEPNNLRWQAQLVQEYCSVREWDVLLNFSQRCFENLKEIQNETDCNHLGTLYIGLIESLMKTNKHEESIEICQKAIQDKNTTAMLKAFAHSYLMENYVAIENWKAAQKYAKRYLELYHQLRKHKELLQIQSTLLVDRAFNAGFIRKAYSVLIYIDIRRNDFKSLHEHYDKLGWSTEEVKVYDKLGQILIEKMGCVEYAPIFSRIITDAYKNDVFRKFMCKEAQEWEEKDAEAYKKIAYVFSQADADDWFIWYNRIVVADVEENKEALDDGFKGLFKTIQNIFYLPEKTYDIIRRNKVNICKLWEDYLGGSWQIHFTNFVKNNELDIVQRVNELIKESFDSEDYKAMLCDLLIMEKQISTETDNVADYRDVLASYCGLKIDFYEKHCVKIEEGLPLDVQAANKIKDFIELENIDKVRALNSLKVVVDLRPDFTEGIKSFLHAYAEEEKQKSANPSDEMLMLRNQVLQQVYMLRDNGMKREAVQIVQQLKGMFPGDEEIVALEERLNQ